MELFEIQRFIDCEMNDVECEKFLNGLTLLNLAGSKI